MQNKDYNLNRRFIQAQAASFGLFIDGILVENKAKELVSCVSDQVPLYVFSGIIRNFLLGYLNNRDIDFVAVDTYKVYKNLSEDQLIKLGKDLLLYFLHDDYARRFRKMLSMAAYHDKELSEAYMKHYVDDPLSYQGMLLKVMVQEGVLHTENAEIMTLHFFAPFYMLITVCDREPEREPEAIRLLEDHIRQFNQLYGRKTK